MATLTSQIQSLNKRVGALESQDLDDAVGVAQIQKAYGRVRLTQAFIGLSHQFPICSETTLCSESLLM